MIMERHRNTFCSRLVMDINKVTEPGRMPELAGVFEPSPKNGTHVDQVCYLGIKISVMYTTGLIKADILLLTVCLTTKRQSTMLKNHMDSYSVPKYAKDRGAMSIHLKKKLGVKATIHVKSSRGMCPYKRERVSSDFTKGRDMFMHAQLRSRGRPILHHIRARITQCLLHLCGMVQSVASWIRVQTCGCVQGQY